MAGDRDWRAAVDIGSLSAEARRALLDAVRAKLGGVGAARAVGLSRAALYRYLSGERAARTTRSGGPWGSWGTSGAYAA